MDPRLLGNIIGFVIVQTLIFALIISTVVYFIKRRQVSFSKILFSWKVLLPALLIAGIVNLPKLTGSSSPSSKEAYSAYQLKEIKAGCVETGNKKGQPSDKVEAFCGCYLAAIQETYPTYKEADAAMSKGLPDQLKPKIQSCNEKIFATSPAVSTASSTGTSKWTPEQITNYTDICLSSLKSKGADDRAAACNCATTAAQKIYPSYSELEQAYTAAKGAPEALKPHLLSCMQKAKG